MDYEAIKKDLEGLGTEELNVLMGHIEFHYPEVLEAKWTQKYKNDLPNSAFLLVRQPVKDKAQDRALPVRDKTGKVDVPHLRNALARVSQVKGFPASAVAAAKRKAQALAKRYLKGGKEESAASDSSEVLSILVKAMEERLDVLEGRISELTSRNSELLQENTSIKEQQKEVVVESILGVMCDIGEVDSNEGDSLKKSFENRTLESLRDTLDDIRYRKEKMPLVVEKVTNPTLSLDTDIAIEEYTIQSDTSILEKAKKGDSDANRYLDKIVKQAMTRKKGLVKTHKEE